MNLPRGVELKSAAIRGGRRTYVLARPLRIRFSACVPRSASCAGRDQRRLPPKRLIPEQTLPPAPQDARRRAQDACRKPQAETQDGIEVSIEVPAGFETDFASIPRLLWPLFPPDGPWLEASIVHDYCYRERVPFSRFFADALFRELMARYGVPRWRRVAFYYAVRLCGWLWWRK